MIEPTAHPKVIFGTASFGSSADPQAKYHSAQTANPILDLLRSRNYTGIDTARAYPVGASGTSESLLGALDVGSWATIDTKVTSWTAGAHSKAGIEASVQGSLSALRVPKVHVLYLHAPDRDTPFEITCRAMNDAYRQGKFERFGLSNYSADEVEQIVHICERDGLVKPSVYQGQYNAIARRGEEKLFPLLRRCGISFYAYSPTAAGLFSGKVSQESINVAGSRWDSSTHLGQIYQNDYFKDELFKAAAQVQACAEAAGLNGHAVALRWILHHSHLSPKYGDGIILGASSVAQLKQNLDVVEQGPLSTELAEKLDKVWEVAKEVAPAYHM